MANPSLILRRAFTLIELLVVIAIIAVLVGILLPTLRSAREAARVAQCGSNQRQLMIAQFAYAGDFNDRPAAGKFWVKNISYSVHAWHTPAQASVSQGVLYPYALNTAIYVCPTAPGFYTRNAGNLASHCRDTDVSASFNYTFNSYLGANIGGGAADGPWGSQKRVHFSASLSGVPKPGATLAFAEQNTFDDPLGRYRIPQDDADFRISTPVPNGTPLDALGSFHGGDDVTHGYTNVVFVDGHVRTATVEESTNLAYSSTDMVPY